MLHAVIPAGGSGTRLWPLSRAARPKFLHALTGTEASLLQATFDRLGGLTSAATTYVVTGVSHAASVARQLPRLPEGNLLVEPSPRDSCAAIGLAAAVIARRDPRAVMGSFAADHLVRDEEAFRATIREAVRGAEDGLLMTVGMKPTHPETGFGYVQCGAAIGDGPIRRVQRFKEKPDHELAVRFVESGDYLWNASMFIWRVDVFLGELERQAPEIYDRLIRIAEAWETPAAEQVLGELWPDLPKVAVEYAVMEGAAEAGKVATVPGDFGWSDVGDFRNLSDLLPGDVTGNVVVSATAAGEQKPAVILHESTGTVVVPNGGRLIAVVGVSDTIVVDTPDVLLVCSRDRAQDVKRIVEQLKERGDLDLI